LLRLAWNLEIEPVATGLRMIAVLSATLVLTMLPASASSPEPSREAFAALAKTCTAAGAFGYDFGHRVVVLPGSAGIPPFFVEDISQGRDGLFEIVAHASFAKAPMSGEDRIALTEWVSRKLDTDITATRQFARREPRRDGVQFIAAAVVFDISRDGTELRLTCTDIARKRAAKEEMRSQP